MRPACHSCIPLGSLWSSPCLFSGSRHPSCTFRRHPPGSCTHSAPTLLKFHPCSAWGHFLPCFSTPVSPGSTTFTNHFHRKPCLRVCSWGIHWSCKADSKDSILKLDPITGNGWCDSLGQVQLKKDALLCAITLVFRRCGEMVTIRTMKLWLVVAGAMGTLKRGNDKLKSDNYYSGSLVQAEVGVYPY